MLANRRRYAAFLWLLCAAAVPVDAATVDIINGDPPGTGFNDPTPVAPVGGNTGTTLGTQRLNAMVYAARIVASRVASTVPIRVAAQFGDLTCSQNSAELGRAAPAQFSANFSGALWPDTYYPLALANALAGRRLAAGTNDIDATFNANLDAGSSQCLHGDPWYYGLDDAHPAHKVDFLGTAVHELIHGLGFVSLVALTDGGGSTVGQFPKSASGARWPDIYSRFIRDLAMPARQQRWIDMTDAQRAQSVTDGPDVVWGDVNTDSQAATLLDAGLNQGYVELYAPDPVQAGSSISHWDPALHPDQIMEPIATGGIDVTHGIGMSACVLENIGWQLINGSRCPDSHRPDIAGPVTVTITNLAQSTVPSGDGGSSRRGGGCAIDRHARFDPFWLVLLVASGWILWHRNRQR